jgi:hypothetical protein
MAEERRLSMRRLRVTIGVVALVALGFSASAATSSASGPHITLVQGQSAPYVTGTGFTAFGPVVLKEFQLGTTGPIWRGHITANADGNIAQFGQCDGSNQIAFRAVDKTTGLKSNKTPYQVYPCIN